MRYLASHENSPRGTFDFPIELYYVDSRHPRYEMPFHWHMECEFILVLEGVLALSVDGEPILAGSGDCVFVQSGAIHGGTPKECVYECLVLDWERFLRESSVCRQKYAAAFGPGVRIQPYFQKGSAAAQVTNSLFECMEKEQPGYEFATTGLLWQFIGMVLQQHLYTADGPCLSAGRRGEQIKTVLDRIRKDYARPLTLDDLAAEAGMAPRYFCRVFRQMLGRTPIDYLN